MCETLKNLVSGDLIDPVTRLPKKEFLDELEKLDDGDMKEIEVSVTLEGVDEKFKDIAISKVASVMKHSVRIPRDMVVRTGEYDFVVLLFGADESAARLVAQRLRDNLNSMTMAFGERPVKVKAVVRVK